MSSATEKWRPPIIGARNNVSNNSDHNGQYTDLGPTNEDGPFLPFAGGPVAAAQLSHCGRTCTMQHFQVPDFFGKPF
jgi:hypothetical protein